MRLYYNQGNFREALKAWNDYYEMRFTDSPYPYYFYIYMYLGEDSLSYQSFLRISDPDKYKEEFNEPLHLMYEQSGTRGILEWLNKVRENKTQSFEFYNLAKRNAILGNNDESLDWLEKAFRAGFVDMPEIYNSYDFRNLRGEPRFNALLRKMNLPEYPLKPEVQTDSYN